MKGVDLWEKALKSCERAAFGSNPDQQASLKEGQKGAKIGACLGLRRAEPVSDDQQKYLNAFGIQPPAPI